MSKSIKEKIDYLNSIMFAEYNLTVKPRGDLQGYFALINTFTGDQLRMKSIVYKIASNLSTENLTPSLLTLLLHDDLDEFISFFPYFKEQAFEVKLKYLGIWGELLAKEMELDEEISQKEFALAVKDVPCNGLLFQARKEQISVESVIENYPKDKLVRLLMKYM